MRLARLRRFLDWLVRLRGSPRAIAGGVAIGVFVAFTPTIGIQTLLCLALATLCNASRPASIVPIWLTNPISAAPVYAFTYYVGTFFWPGPDGETVARAMGGVARELEALDLLALRAHLEVYAGMGVDVFVPMWIGGVLVGLLAAAFTYPLTLWTVVELRARRERRRRRRDQRRRESSTP